MESNLSARRLVTLLMAGGAALAVLLVVFAINSTANAAPRHHHHAARHARRAQSDPSAANEQSGVDTDNVQSGDQSGPDQSSAGNAIGSDNEPQASEGENAGTDADGPGGPDATGDHQCPPACAPGEAG